jgi:hypothetical protein
VLFWKTSQAIGNNCKDHSFWLMPLFLRFYQVLGLSLLGIDPLTY